MQPLLLCLLSSSCPPGEYGLDPPNCTSCWPCEPGFQCASGVKKACGASAWSSRGLSHCIPCDEACPRGLLRVRACDGVGDLVCAVCPPGFGCSGGPVASLCAAGTYSVGGVCAECGQNRSSDAGATECVCLGAECSGCPPGEVAVGTQCRRNPEGYGLVSGELQRCPRDTYSTDGRCVPCDLNARSEPGSECVCVEGYVRRGGCVPCEAGTVFRGRECVLCDAGEYCLGRTHHEQCPSDMYSHRGAGMCAPCRMNSGCLERCFSEADCTCDAGYVDASGECRRCRAGTREESGECAPCPAGHECKGGAEVWQCPLTTWSPGNTSSCLACDRCSEITASRCNSTHNSVCEPALAPLGVLSVLQQYTAHQVDGELFGTFALLYVASIPRAQLLRVCDKERCVQCFQGLCPARMRQLSGPGYELAFEVRNFASRIDDSVELLNHPTRLRELAAAAMRKVSGEPFLLLSRVERSVICPAGLVWDRTDCRVASPEPGRSWVGLALSALILASLALAWRCSRVAEPSRVVLVEADVAEDERDANTYVAKWGRL